MNAVRDPDSGSFAERAAAPALLIALALPILFYGLGRYGIVNGDEALYHAMARQMLESGNWFRLEFAGQERIYDTLTHAPLYLWLKALVIAALGDSPWAMRLPSAVFGAAAVLATYALVCELCDRRAGFLAALFQLTTYQYVYLHSARTGEMETAVALAFTLAALFFLRAVERGRSFIPHHLCLVALLNLKAPIIVIPLLAELIFFALHRPAREGLRAWFTTALWLLPLGASWHIAQLFVHWDDLPAVIAMVSDHAAGGEIRHLSPQGILGHARFYVMTWLGGVWPYPVLSLVAWAAVLARARGTSEWGRWLFLSIMPVTVFVYFLLIALRHPWYLHPWLPFMCAFLAVGLADLERKPPSLAVCAALALALSLTLWLQIPFAFNPFADRSAAWWPRVSWVSTAGIGPLVGVPLLALLGAVAIALAVRAGRTRALATSIAFGLVAMAALRVAMSLAYVDHVSEFESFARELKRAKASGRAIEYPVELHDTAPFRAHYFFADEFELEEASPELLRQGVGYLLRPKPSH